MEHIDRNLVILIPCHSLDDFPTEGTEAHAAGLLDAFACAWHPALLRWANTIPQWMRADEPDVIDAGSCVIVPESSDGWLPAGWKKQQVENEIHIIADCRNRDDYINAIRELVGDVPEVDPDLTRDFLALGHCWLQIQMLSRQMHHFGDLNEDVLEQSAVLAANSLFDNDPAATRTHLTSAFETLTNLREEFYPVGCYWFDLCLLAPDQANEHFETVLDGETPLNILVTGKDLEAIADAHPARVARLKERCLAESAEIVGGDYLSLPVPLVPLSAALADLERGRRIIQQRTGKVPRAWGRRRYGLTTLLPQILSRFGYQTAMHVLLDDGVYPDQEESKAQWEGADGSMIDAVSRIPLAADSALSFLRLRERLSEAMEYDQVAALTFAHWPEMRTPYLEDLQRMQRYSPVLGQFVTFAQLSEENDESGHYSMHEEYEYFPPFLVQAIARRGSDSISRFRGYHELQQHAKRLLWMHQLSRTLRGQSVDQDFRNTWNDRLLDVGPDEPEEARDVVRQEISQAETTAQAELASVFTGATGSPGVLLVNPLLHSRRLTLPLPEGVEDLPAIGNGVKSVQHDPPRFAVEIPGAGFVWIPRSQPEKPEETKGPALADEFLVRNEQFEVTLHEETGGIARLKNHGRSPNRLSTQVAFRFPSERTFSIGEGDNAKQDRSAYSAMRKTSVEVLSTGPLEGSVRTTGELFDQTDGSVVAEFEQTVSVFRGQNTVDVDLKLQPRRKPEGDPWSNYYAVRLAWNDSTAAVTRSVMDAAFGFRGERINTSSYIEIAEGEQRTTILTHGPAFLRKQGRRMADLILQVEGESATEFRFSIAVDEQYPQSAALSAETPFLAIPTETGPPPTGAAGWLFHCSAKNIQWESFEPLLPEKVDPADDAELPTEPPAKMPSGGFAVRLRETEGRRRDCRLRCFRGPSYARVRDFEGRTLSTPAIEEDAVHLSFSPYEIQDIELRFDAT